MFSFLTYEYRKKIINVYRKRLLAVYLFGIIFVSFFSVAMLVPTYMISISRKAEVNTELDSLKNSLDLKKNNDTESFILGASSKIQALVDSQSKGYITTIVNNIVNQKESGISLSDFTLEKNQTGLKVTLGGLALTRDELLDFVKKLKSKDSFKSVDLPVSVLAKDKNISFKINLEAFF